MKVIKGGVNDVSEELKPKKLQKGEVIIYQMLNGHVNPIKEERATRPYIFPFASEIPSTDRIYDPHKKDYVDIALVESFDKEKNVIPRKIKVFGTTGGKFSCSAGIIADEEQYEYLEMTNYNKSNPNRDESVEPLFERVDVIGTSKANRKKRNDLLEALKYAQALTDGEAKEFAASVGWNETDPIDIIRDRIEDFAQTKPSEFIKTVEAKDREIKAVIKRGIDAGVINYDTQQHKITIASNNNTLIKMDRVEGVDYLTQAADYVMHNKNGDKVFQTIKRLLQPNNAAV